MREPCCGKDNTMKRDIHSIGDVMNNLLDRVRFMLRERDKKLEEIEKREKCPGSCIEGTLTLKLQIMSEYTELRVPCPIAGVDCEYGISLEKQINRRLAGLLVSAVGVPRRHVTCFDRYIDTVATKEAARWSARGFLVFCGKTGSGKSFGAAWFAYRHIRSLIGDPYRHHALEWRTRAENAASSVKWYSARDVSEDRKTAAGAKYCSLLVLDDLGKECDLPGAQAAVRDIVSRRYDDDLPTLITTELTVPDIETRYGRAIVERLVGEEGDGGKFITCGDVSLRLEGIKLGLR